MFVNSLLSLVIKLNIITYVIILLVKNLPHEETRKIIRVGNSFAVTLPRAWARYNRVAGKEQVLVVSDGSVVIHAPEKKKVPV